ncbi:MAG: cation-translocating P-type ATPase [Lachnospiraceae bacterium]|nr:cation-translocating P-type ATPase [Lachnospiraceae bacterium]
MKAVISRLEWLSELGGMKKDIILLVISGAAVLCSLAGWTLFPFDMAWIAIVFCGIPIIMEAIIGLVTAFDIKADVLVSIALIASVITGEIFAAGEVAVIMQLGGLLEELTVARARSGIEKLVKLTPTTARILAADGKETIVPSMQVRVGDKIRVLPGETVPVDGVILSGQTSIDQAVMTGESMPVDKAAGDEVSSGTVNQFGAFDMEATKVGEDSSIQRMIRLVQSADAGKAKIVGIADRWATWIVVIALSAAAITWLLTGQIIRAVTILVVFCPCALVLATPTAIMAAIGNATKHGFLVKEGDALERLAKAGKITFDKTGTLTYGTPKVICAKSILPGVTSEEIYASCAAAEQLSEHPLGRAIVKNYRAETGKDIPSCDQFAMLPGRGVSAVVNGVKILAGNFEMMAETGIVRKDQAEKDQAEKDLVGENPAEKTIAKQRMKEKDQAKKNLTEKETAEKGIAEKSTAVTDTVLVEAGTYLKQGCTVIYVSADDHLTGFLVLADTPRENSVSMIDQLKKLSVEPVLLTGDNEEAAASIAGQLHIEEVHAECLPEDKLKWIGSYQKKQESVCMIGDGVNDAPALKKADIGIAMGGIGSDIAVDAADIALVDDKVEELPHLVALSKRMMTTIRLNMTFSMTLNFIAIILAITGILNPIVGALVHNAGSVLVIINSALLLNWSTCN